MIQHGHKKAPNVAALRVFFLALSYFKLCPRGYFLRELSQYSNNAARIATSKGARNSVRKFSSMDFHPLSIPRGRYYHIKIFSTLSNALKGPYSHFNL